MSDLRDVPPNEFLSHVIESITATAEAEIRSYIKGRISDTNRGAETPELAAVFIDKYAAGMSAGLSIAGIRNNIVQIADDACRKIDPQFEEHRRSRWAARPAALACPN